MTISLTDVFDCPLILQADRMGGWLLRESNGRSLYAQSLDDQEAITDCLIIEADLEGAEWVALKDFLSSTELDTWCWPVPMSNEDWNLYTN